MSKGANVYPTVKGFSDTETELLFINQVYANSDRSDLINIRQDLFDTVDIQLFTGRPLTYPLTTDVTLCFDDTDFNIVWNKVN